MTKVKIHVIGNSNEKIPVTTNRTSKRSSQANTTLANANSPPK